MGRPPNAEERARAVARQRKRYQTDPAWRARRNEANRQSYQRHREKRVAEVVAWRKANPERVAEINARRWAKRTCAPLELLATKPAACPICARKRKISFDHCHASGKFRGWLCSSCNMALGLVADNPETLRRLAAYLEGGTTGNLNRET